jgi:hypothetical protein
MPAARCVATHVHRDTEDGTVPDEETYVPYTGNEGPDVK